MPENYEPSPRKFLPVTGGSNTPSAVVNPLQRNRGVRLLLQQMPGNRVQIAPQYIAELAAWIATQAQQWIGASRRRTTGLTGAKLARAEGAIRYAEHCLTCCEQLISRLAETVDRRTIDDVIGDFWIAQDGRVISERSLEEQSPRWEDDDPTPPETA